MLPTFSRILFTLLEYHTLPNIPYLGSLISQTHLQTHRNAGWWGHDPSTRFAMPPLFSPIRGAQGFQQSNPSVLSVVSLLGSLQVFKQAGMMPPLRARSLVLTAHLEALLRQTKRYVHPRDVRGRYGRAAEFSGGEGEGAGGEGSDESLAFTIITPEDPEARGAQLSLLILPPGRGVMQRVADILKAYGVIGDERKPDVIRLAPAPLYNTIEDCERAASALVKAFEEIEASA